MNLRVYPLFDSEQRCSARLGALTVTHWKKSAELWRGREIGPVTRHDGQCNDFAQWQLDGQPYCWRHLKPRVINLGGHCG